MESSLDTWFKREILVHERLLMQFLARAWPRADERADLRQEAYARVYRAAKVSRPYAAKAFLFSTARHLMADYVRRDRIVSIHTVRDADSLNVLVDEISPERRVGARQELGRLAHAFDRLPDRCREVVWLRRVQDFSQREIADRLGLSEKTVEKHIANGSRLLAQYMRSDSLTPPGSYVETDKPVTEDAPEHGQRHTD